MMEDTVGAREAILRTVAFFDVVDYPPTQAEVMAWMESEHPFNPACHQLIAEGLLESGAGRVALRDRLESLLTLVRERTPLFPRKIRAARRVTRWLARNPAVRFVALANTTALAHARDAGDLDFFVVVRHGHIWSTRLLGGALYRIAGRLSGGAHERPDDVCLSYFISDAGLDLSSHMLPEDDPYFRYWFLALLPLYDDGVSCDLWQANATITSRHPSAEPWIMSPDISVRRPLVRIPTPSFIEPLARRFQEKWFPSSIRERIGKGNDVVVSDTALKFHVDDGRLAYRAAYRDRLRSLDVARDRSLGLL